MLTTIAAVAGGERPEMSRLRNNLLPDFHSTGGEVRNSQPSVSDVVSAVAVGAIATNSAIRMFQEANQPAT